MPGLAACLRLAEALGVPVERLAEGTEDPAGEEGDHTPEHGRKGKERPVTARPLARRRRGSYGLATVSR
jgi:hypothetical protein